MSQKPSLPQAIKSVSQALMPDTTGLSVRFLSVTILLGRRAIGSSTGKTLSSERSVGNLMTEGEKIVRKRPVGKLDSASFVFLKLRASVFVDMKPLAKTVVMMEPIVAGYG